MRDFLLFDFRKFWLSLRLDGRHLVGIFALCFG